MGQNSFWVLIILHYRKDKLLLEKVQHRFTRLFDNLKDLEYNERLRKLNLWTLEERRNCADLIELIQDGTRHLSCPTEFIFLTR